MKKIFQSVVLLVSLIALNAQASLVLEHYGSAATPTSIGGYEMTDFDLLEPGSLTSSISSPLGGTLKFKDRDRNLLDLTEGTANNIDWWVNGETKDYNTYTTDISWIKIILPKKTLAISFNIGADLSRGRGWLNAVDTDRNRLGREYFRINDQYTPGFGIYADNSNVTADNCSYVRSVVIDPIQWGIGNFSIAQGDCASTVPEPSIIALMSFGLIGLGVARRKMK